MIMQTHGFGMLQDDGTVKIVGIMFDYDQHGQPHQKRFSANYPSERDAVLAGFRFERGLRPGENVRLLEVQPSPPAQGRRGGEEEEGRRGAPRVDGHAPPRRQEELSRRVVWATPPQGPAPGCRCQRHGV